MKFVLASWGTRGEVEPFIAVGAELVRRGHDVRMAVAPELIGFAESAGPAAVGFGPKLQVILDAHRDFFTCLFRNPWRIRELNSLLREVSESLDGCYGEISATLTSLSDGADAIVTGINFEDAAVDAAEYCDIPLVALHIFAQRANGRLLPFLPAPLGRSVMTAFEWLSWRGRRKVEDAQRRELGLPNAPGPWPRRITESERWKSRPMTKCAIPGWQPNGRNSMANGPLSAR
jgi:UDP:flavonoid glycosyltransferase YjiC (YdhE family)